MATEKPNNVVGKLDPDQLREHQAALDASYRGLQRVYKLLTYENGRLSAEPGMAALPGEFATRLEALAERVHDLGRELKTLAWNEIGESPDAPEVQKPAQH